MLDLIGREPVVTAVLAVVGALVALLVAFGVDLSATQQAAIGGFCAAALGLAIAVRKRVTPMSRPGDPYARARVLERAYEQWLSDHGRSAADDTERSPYSRVPGYKRELERQAALAKQAKPKE